MDLSKEIADLIKDLEEWEEECDRILQFGYSIPFAQGEFIQVSASKLRRLRSAFEQISQ